MFYCEFCEFVHSTLNSHLKHLKEHSILNNKLICGFNRCDKVYSVVTSLQSHVRRCHDIRVNDEVFGPTINGSPSVTSKSFISKVCTVESCTQKYTDRKQMISHLRMHINNGYTIKCGYLNCEKTYNKLNSFSSHITKCHKEKSILQQSSHVDDSNNHLGFDYPIVENNDNLVDVRLSSEEHQHQYCVKNSSDVFVMNLAHFFLKLKFKFSLPASTVQYIASEISKMSQKNEEILKQSLSMHLQQCSNSADVIKDIIDASLENNLFNNIEDTLGSSFKRRNFFEKHFPYVNPVQIPLPSTNDKKRFYHYVPLKETLKNLFYNKSLTHELKFDLLKNDSKVLKDFTDGIVFKENKFFQQNPGALQLISYQDAFETVNPLGSAKTKYKILAVYLSIGNFPDRIRSHVNSMYLGTV